MVINVDSSTTFVSSWLKADFVNRQRHQQKSMGSADPDIVINLEMTEAIRAGVGYCMRTEFLN